MGEEIRKEKMENRKASTDQEDLRDHAPIRAGVRMTPLEAETSW